MLLLNHRDKRKDALPIVCYRGFLFIFFYLKRATFNLAPGSALGFLKLRVTILHQLVSLTADFSIILRNIKAYIIKKMPQDANMQNEHLIRNV